MAEKTHSDKSPEQLVAGGQSLQPKLSYRDGEVFSFTGIDEALFKKMELVNA